MLERHPQIIKDRAVVDDDWSVLRLAEGETPDTVELPDDAAAGKLIVPLAVWQARRDALAERASRGALGVWLAPDESPATLGDDLPRLAVIAIDFPKFTDGRGYSIAYNLRRRLGWTGELRAIGDVLRDQLFQMARCGFDAFATRQDRNIHDALKGLSVFSETYQASVDNPVPLFRRVPRDAANGSAAEHRDLGAGI